MLNRAKAIRAWCGKCEFKGMEPFILGSVYMPEGSMDHEVQKALQDLWASMVPYPAPSYIRPIKGFLFFSGDSNV